MHASIAVLLLLMVHWGLQAPLGEENECTDNHSEEPLRKKKKTDSSSKCYLTFSELKPGCNEGDQVCDPFIEIQADCKQRPGPPPGNAINNYKLVIIGGNPLSLVMIVNFEEFPFDGKKNYLVIGAPNVPNLDISLSSPYVQTIFSTTVSSLMIPSAKDERAYSLLLLKDIGKVAARIFHLPKTVDGRSFPRRLTNDQITLIASKSVDMMFLGKEQHNIEEQLMSIWKLKSAKPMYLPNWNEILQMQSQSSLSMCAEVYEGYAADAFQITPASPGSSNNCIQIDESANTNPDVNDCRAESISNLKIHHDVSGNQLQEIKDFKFQDVWIQNCQQHFPKRENILQSSNVQEWIKFNQPGLPEECRFICVACTTYTAHGFRPDIKKRSHIVTGGFWSKDIYDNGDTIKSHQLVPLHAEAMEYYRKMKSAQSINEAKAVIYEFEEKERGIFNATMNVLSIVYAEVKAGVSFHTHPTFMKTMQKVGLNVGRLHHTDNGAQQMTTTIAKSFHHKLLSQLVKNQPPFSIMVDSSTSYNQPFLAVYILTLENGYPVTHFYALVHMEEGEKAIQMSKSFTNQIESDSEIVPGFQEFFKSKIVSFVSDGAAVMVGDRKSFKVYLSQYVGRNVPNIVCLAHKLDSSYKAGIKAKRDVIKNIQDTIPVDKIKLWQLTYFEGFEKSVNDFYTFYASRGYKRWLNLLTTAEDLGILPKRLKYIYNIRWSESHYRALETLMHNYYVMVDDLQNSISNADYDYTTQTTASDLHSRLTDKTFMVVIHEFLDILTTFQAASRMFQESSSIVVGKAKLVYDTLISLQEYKMTGGIWLKDFLKNIICSQSSDSITLRCDEGDCTLGYYELCDEITMNNVKIKNNFPVKMAYVDVRNIVYDNLISSVKNYFDLQILDSFELFNPGKLNFCFNENNDPVSLDKLYTVDESYLQYQPFKSYEDRLSKICEFYSLESCDQMRIDWPILVKCLILNEFVSLHKSDDPTRFWPMAFTQCSTQWTPVTLKAVTSALVTGYSSAECERGFSVMNLIKTKGRSRLEKDTLEANMRVRINGPSVEEFDAYEYSIEFLKAHRRVDDEVQKGGRKPSEEKFCNAMKKSGIY